VFLKKVYEAKVVRLKKKKEIMPQAEMERRIYESKKRPLMVKFSERYPEEVKIIAEFKNASPSSGLLGNDVDFKKQLRSYENGGASAVSIVTEEEYFGGDLGYLRSAKEITELPVLRKDFIVDPYEIVESKYFGVDAILLIAEMLDTRTIKEFLKICLHYEMDVLLEVHREDALMDVLRIFDGQFLLGINSRDLSSLTIDHGHAEKLLSLVPREVPVIIESGIRDREDILRFIGYGVSGFLVGTTLMKSENPEMIIKWLKNGKG